MSFLKRKVRCPGGLALVALLEGVIEAWGKVLVGMSEVTLVVGCGHDDG